MVREITVVPDADALAERAADSIRDSLLGAVTERGGFDMVLTGGRTPVELYRRLGGVMRGEIPWEVGALWWGDERCVPPDDEESNYGLAARTLLRELEMSQENIHPMLCDVPDAEEAARRYEEELRATLPPGRDFTFDLMLLGMGEDGHIASLFPGDPVLEESRRWVRAVRAPAWRPPPARLSLTFPVINASREIMLLVSGEAKAQRVAEVLRQQREETPVLPAARVRPLDRLHWILDEAAAQSAGDELVA